MKKMLAIVAALGVSTAAFADLIALVDFGMNTQMTTPGTETWNNLAVAGSPAASPVGPILMGANGGAMNLPSYTLLDTTGASTGWVISVARLTNSLGGIGTSGAGGNYSGTVAPDVAAFAPYSAHKTMYMSTTRQFLVLRSRA
ncbi:MAG: hypothetical protein KBA51_02885 [Kiritimatiellae bacterium]|nr:hypothetical protein [Kiritimatiellia bacterium]